MSNLSYQEKRLYAELFGMFAFLGAFVAYAAIAPSDRVSRAIIAFTLIYFIYSLFVNRKARFKQGNYLIDERDWQIESRGIRTSQTTLMAGITFILVRFWDQPPLSPTRIFNLLVVTLILSSVAKIVQMLRLYRTSL
jgi:hypothetical protein